MAAMTRENAPVTWTAFGGLPIHGPTPLEREWMSLMEDDEDVILLWGGAWKRRGIYLGWMWCNLNVGGENNHGGHPHPVTRVPAEGIERLLCPLAHEARVRLMQAMHNGPKSSGQLVQATGLKGGNLYYHLKELMHAAYVKETDGAYDLTPFGCQMLLTVATIAEQVVKDRGEEGLLVAPRPPTGSPGSGLSSQGTDQTS